MIHCYALVYCNFESILMYCILQDLSLYQNDELLHESLYLLSKTFSAEESLFENAIQTQVS